MEDRLVLGQGGTETWYYQIECGIGLCVVSIGAGMGIRPYKVRGSEIGLWR